MSEFFPDELALILNCSRAAATQLWERSTTLRRRLPATWAALADGWLDWARARAIAAELGWPARESPDDVLAAVEAVVLPQATGLSITRLRALVRAELIKADPAAADRRRKKAERDADVTVRGVGNGMGELRATMPLPEAAEVRAEVDAHARALKKAGDERPIGQLRSALLHDLVTPPVAGAAGGERARRGGGLARHAGVARRPGRRGRAGNRSWSTASRSPPPLARELLERLDALLPGRAPGADRRHAVPLDHRRGRAAGRRRHPPRAGDRRPARARGWARRRRWTATCPPPPSDGSAAPAIAPAGTPAAATAPAGPTSTTSSRTPTAGRPTAPTCAASAAGTTG